MMPQAVRIKLPTIVSQCLIVLKDTSLCYIIMYGELVRRGSPLAITVPNGTVLSLMTVAAVFISINYALSRLAQYLERGLGRRPGTARRVRARRSVSTPSGPMKESADEGRGLSRHG